MDDFIRIFLFLLQISDFSVYFILFIYFPLYLKLQNSNFYNKFLIFYSCLRIFRNKVFLSYGSFVFNQRKTNFINFSLDSIWKWITSLEFSTFHYKFTLFHSIASKFAHFLTSFEFFKFFQTISSFLTKTNSCRFFILFHSKFDKSIRTFQFSLKICNFLFLLNCIIIFRNMALFNYGSIFQPNKKKYIFFILFLSKLDNSIRTFQFLL